MPEHAQEGVTLFSLKRPLRGAQNLTMPMPVLPTTPFQKVQTPVLPVFSKMFTFRCRCAARGEKQRQSYIKQKPASREERKFRGANALSDTMPVVPREERNEC